MYEHFTPDTIIIYVYKNECFTAVTYVIYESAVAQW